MSRPHVTLGCIFLALLTCGSLPAVRAGTSIPSYSSVWTYIDPLNCFVVNNYRITNNIFSTFKSSSVGACYRRCADSWLAMGAAARNCQSWTYNKRSKRCSLTDGYLGLGSEEGRYPLPNWVRNSAYTSGYLLDKYDRR